MPSKKRPRPRWNATVTLPAARPAADQTPPRLVMATPEGDVIVDTGQPIPLDRLLPARTFRSTVGQRHAPQQPYLHVLSNHVKVESLAEATVAHLYSAMGDVARLWPQPFWIERVVGERPSWACPDFLVESLSGDLTVVEVKSGNSRLGRQTLIGLDAVRRSCRLVGLNFDFVTGMCAADEDVFNALHSFGSSRVPSGPGWEWIRDDLLSAAQKPTALRDLWQLGPSWQVKPLVWWMCWGNQLCFDWSDGIWPTTQLLNHDSHLPGGVNADLAWRCGPRPRPTLDELLMVRR